MGLGLLTKTDIIEHMTGQLGLTRQESELYFLLVTRSSLTISDISESLNKSDEVTNVVLAALLEKGLIIEQPSADRKYSALHPRMALSNVFKTWEAEMVKELRNKRSVVDRLAVALIPIFEEAREAERKIAQRKGQ